MTVARNGLTGSVTAARSGYVVIEAAPGHVRDERGPAYGRVENNPGGDVAL